MSFTTAKRRNIPIIAGIAGPSGSGKTYSALRIAAGLADGKPIAFIDTERGRALHYADDFEFLHDELDSPFTPERYGKAIQEASALDPGVIVVDSFTHEWAGEGGVLDIQEAEFERLGRRDAAKFSSWIKPKAAHKALVNDVLLRLPCHLIVCLRAEEKVEMLKNAQTGKLEVVPKRTLAGHVGWIPVCAKDFPYELTVSLVVTPDKPGVPVPIKLQEQHRQFVPLDRPLDENVGSALAEWARGSGAVSSATPSAAGTASTVPAAPEVPEPSASPPAPDTAAAPTGGSGQLKPTTGQKRKIGVLLSALRDQSGTVTTEQLWANLAKARAVDVDVMIELLHGRDDEGVLHFGPLLADMSRDEAARLIDWFERVEARAKAAA